MGANNECDTAADTFCLGKNFVILSYTSRVADVYGYNSAHEPIHNVPIVSGATAYDCPITNEMYVLVFHESIYYGTGLDHTLINPNQVCYNGIPFWDNPFDEEQGLCIHASETLFIFLQMKGSKIHFASRFPTNCELHECPQIEMTSQIPWDPKNVQLSPVDRMINAIPCMPIDMRDNSHFVKSVST